jgi:SNF2 family DNA or RNA helicase
LLSVIVTVSTKINAENLGSVQFHRLIYDEGHAARRESSTVFNVGRIGSWSTWLVTGTPLYQGGVKDLLGYCKFLGLWMFRNDAVFHRCISSMFAEDDGALGLQRVRGLISKFLRRYTKDDVEAELGLPPMPVTTLFTRPSPREIWTHDSIKRAIEHALFKFETKPPSSANRARARALQVIKTSYEGLRRRINGGFAASFDWLLLTF